MVSVFTLGWIQEVLDVPLPQLARAVGLNPVRSGSWSPCLACGAEQRGSSDSRGPIGFRPDEQGWRCHPCGLTGNGVTLVALAVTGEPRPRGAPWSRIRAWCEAKGWVQPRGRSTRAGRTGGSSGRPQPQRRPPPRSPRPPKRLPPQEVARLWNLCAPVLDDEEVCGWLRSRAIDPATVEDLDLGRALPADPSRSLHRWARFRGRLWPRTGHRLLLPMFDAEGHMASLQGRSIHSDPKPGEKAANPAGTQLAGLVFADGLGQQLLRGEQTEPAEVVITEGVPDYLTRASCWGVDGALEDAPAVFGVVAGSWRGAQGEELAARIPDGSRIVIRTHGDAAGDRYAEEIRRTLRGRCDVHRGGVL